MLVYKEVENKWQFKNEVKIVVVLEYKVKGKQSQYNAIDDAIRTTQFIRNKAIRYWMDASRELKVDKFALNKYSTELRKEFNFVAELNSMAVQSAAERGWFAISRFYDNCKSKKCSSCGVIVKKSLSTRSHICNCGCELHRDTNAAINILNLAKARDGQSQSNANGLVTSTLLGENLVEQVTRLKLESPCL
jgi:transposase